MNATELYPSPAHGGRLKPLPVVQTLGNLNALHVVGGPYWDAYTSSPTAWDRHDPDVQATLDWMNGYRDTE